MSLLGWILLPVNVIGYLWAWRAWMRLQKGEWYPQERFDGFSFYFFSFVGIWVAIPWPGWMVVLGVKRLINRYGMGRSSEIVASLILNTRADRKAKRLKPTSLPEVEVIHEPLGRWYGP